MNTIKDHTLFDYTIIGAGASGMHVIWNMMLDPWFQNKRILLIEKESDKQNDRTWCFWEKGQGQWDNLLEKTWDQAVVCNDQSFVRKNLQPYTYKMLRSASFYTHILQRVENFKNITVRKEEVLQIVEEKNSCQIITESGNRYTSAYVLNSWLNYVHHKGPHPDLKQHFGGWFISASEASVNKLQLDFMNFSVPQFGNTRFMYVLPYHKNKALIEYTLFSEKLLEKEAYEKAIVQFLEQHNITDYTLEEKEFGVIPMTTYPYWKHNTARQMYIGSAGGWTKPSTGYTFKASEKHAYHLAAFLKKQKPLNALNLASRYHFYDRVLLEVLKKHNDQGHQVFTTMFVKNPVDRIFRFLDNESCLLEELLIMYNAQPRKLFLKAVVKSLFS